MAQAALNGGFVDVGTVTTGLRLRAPAGGSAYAETGITHHEVGHLMIYDACAHLPNFGLEDLGFAARREAGEFIAEGNTRPGGRLPMNTNGGCLSYMHSGRYGMYALQEGVRQMGGQSPAQEKDAEKSVVHGVGGMFFQCRNDKSEQPKVNHCFPLSAVNRMMTAVIYRDLKRAWQWSLYIKQGWA